MSKASRANNDFMRQNGWVLQRVRVLQLDESSCRVGSWPLRVLWPWILSSITVDFPQEPRLCTLLLHCPLLSLSLSLSLCPLFNPMLLLSAVCSLEINLLGAIQHRFVNLSINARKSSVIQWWCKICWFFFSFGSTIESSIMLLLTASSEFPSQLGGFTVVLLVEVDAVNWRV